MRPAFALAKPRILLEAARTRILLRPANDNMDDDPPPGASARVVAMPWLVETRASVVPTAA